MTAERVTYLDSSAIVKIVVREEESAALLRHLRRRRPIVSSALSRTEVGRAVLHLGPRVAERVGDVLGRLDLISVSERVLKAAAALPPPGLRSLDAIHLATASLLGDTLGAVVTYDVRMAAAARGMGWTVVSPA